MQFIDGGVTAPMGFTANGVLSGVKKGRTKEDTALIRSDRICTAAGVFTQNRVQAEPVKLTKKHLLSGTAYAIVANSGNANACTGEQGLQNATRMCVAAANAINVAYSTSLQPENVLVASTGVIGQQLPVECIEAHMTELAMGLSKEGHERARQAIMTTDTKYKECAVETTIGGKTVRIGTMAKGSGMIHINMGTMLGFVTTDCAISADMLQAAIRESAQGTYNCVSIDGDTSTNDSLMILANGAAGNKEITSFGDDYTAFLLALNAINTKMARKIAGDGEGAEHLIECTVTGALDIPSARKLAKSVISSNLVKAMVFGKDANLGRILCALGYSGEFFTPDRTSLFLESAVGKINVFDHGTPVNFDEDLAKRVLAEPEVHISVLLEDGSSEGTAWGCDLTYDYVKINGDYRT